MVVYINICRTSLRNLVLDFHHDFCTHLYNRNGIRQINLHNLPQLSKDFQDKHLPMFELKINSYQDYMINVKIKPGSWSIPDALQKICFPLGPSDQKPRGGHFSLLEIAALKLKPIPGCGMPDDPTIHRSLLDK